MVKIVIYFLTKPLVQVKLTSLSRNLPFLAEVGEGVEKSEITTKDWAVFPTTTFCINKFFNIGKPQMNVFSWHNYCGFCWFNVFLIRSEWLEMVIKFSFYFPHNIKSGHEKYRGSFDRFQSS